MDHPDQVHFHNARLAVSGLREWLWQPWGTNRSRFAGEGEGVMDVELRAAKLSFRREARGKHDQFETRQEFRASATFEFESAISLSEFKEHYSTPLHDLVLLGIHEETRIESMTLLLPDEHEKWWGDRKPIRGWHEIEVVERTNTQPLRPRRNRYRHGLIPLTAWGDEAPERIRTWFELRRDLGGLGDLLFATLNVRYIYLENQVLNLMSFAEGYHRLRRDQPPLERVEHERLVKEMLAVLESDRQREIYRDRLRHANELSQRRRLRQVFERAGEVLEEAMTWRKDELPALLDTRNYLTHWGEKTENVVEGEELLLSLRRLQIVIEVNLLLDIGTPGETIEAAVRGHYGSQRILRQA